MFGANDNLSKAASLIWRSYEQLDRDLAMDGSGELGGVIVSQFNRYRNAAVTHYGFTPETYNQALRDRLVGDDYPHMSYAQYRLLSVLEVESPEEHYIHSTFVDTGGEQSSLAYLGVTAEDVEFIDGEPRVRGKV